MTENKICGNNEEANGTFNISEEDCVFEVEELEDNDDICYDDNEDWDFTVDNCNNMDSCFDNDFCENQENNDCHDKCDWDNDCDYDCNCDCDCDCDCDCNGDDNEAELLIEKSVNKEEAFRGEILRYCIVIKNVGNLPACNVNVKDNLDRCLQYVNGSLRINNKKVCGCIWNNISIKMIKPSECVKITFEAAIRNCDEDRVENYAVCCYSYFPNNCSNRVNDKAVSNTVCTRLLDMEVDMVKRANKECFRIGEIVKYTIDITNRSNATIECFVLKDKLSSSLKCLEILCRGQRYNCCKLCSGINLGQICPGETISVVIKARVEGMGENGRILNKACGHYTLNGIVCENVESNTVAICVTFNQCKEVCLKDIVKLSCEMGPAIGIVDSAAKVEIKKVNRIGGCGCDNRIRICGVVKTKYVYDKGYNCHKKICSEVPFDLILRIPSKLRNVENLDLKVCLKEICPRIICGYTIESDIKLEVCLKSK